MNTGRAALRIGEQVSLVAKNLPFIVAATLVVALVYGIAGPGLNGATRFHPAVGVVSAVDLMFVLTMWLWFSWRQPTRTTFFGRYFATTLIANLALISLLGTVTMGTVSYAAHAVDAISYTANGSITIGGLADYYGWSLVDTVPGLWEALGVDASTASEDSSARALVWLFRALVGAAALAFITRRTYIKSRWHE